MLLLSVRFFAQHDSAKVPFLRDVAIGVNMGALFPLLKENNTQQQLGFFKNVATNSKFTNTNFVGYKKSGFSHSANFLPGAFIDMDPMDLKTKKRNKNIMYRLS